MAESSTAINTYSKNFQSFITNKLVYNKSSKNIKPVKSISNYKIKKINNESNNNQTKKNKKIYNKSVSRYTSRKITASKNNNKYINYLNNSPEKKIERKSGLKINSNNTKTLCKPNSYKNLKTEKIPIKNSKNENIKKKLYNLINNKTYKEKRIKYENEDKYFKIFQSQDKKKYIVNNNIKDIINLNKLDNTDFLNNKKIKIKNSNYVDKQSIITNKEKSDDEKDNNGIDKLGKYYMEKEDKDNDNNEDSKYKKYAIKMPQFKLNEKLLNIIKENILNSKNNLKNQKIKNESKNLKIYKKKKVINHNFNKKQIRDEKTKIKSNGNLNNVN